MEFLDILFPPRIALGAQRKPAWNTTVVKIQNGSQNTNQNWSRALHSYDISMAVRDEIDYDDVVQHFHSVRGRAKKFPFKDALDYRVEATRGVLLDDGDSPTTGYHLGKTYGTGAAIYNRRISRPKSGTVAIYRLRAGSLTTITGNATISYTTGFVTFTGGTVIGGDVLTWSGQFYVPCAYDTDELPGLIIDRKSDGKYLVRCDNIQVVEVLE